MWTCKSPLTLLQDTSVDSDSGAVKAKHADNPFVEQMQSTTVVDMDGKLLYPQYWGYGLTAITVRKMGTTVYKVFVILYYNCGMLVTF